MMNVMIGLALAAIIIFTWYCINSVYILGIPYSLSGTYYLFNEKIEGFGVIFTVMMLVVFILLMAPWMYLTTIISTWSMYFTVLPFITCACMCFVGLAPNIRTSSRIEKIHTISALVGAICAISWLLIACWKLAYILPAWIFLCGAVAHLTKTAKSCRDWWLEMSIFGATFTAIIVEFFLCLL